MRLIEKISAWTLVLILAVPPMAPAQTSPPAASPPANPFTAEQLDQLAAPIALYPDPLIAQILMASTYPLEVVQAARFAKGNASLKGDSLDQALKNQDWDDSVKSLVTFPQVLTMMDSKLDWTQKLGDAFLAQQKDLMNAIQRLRARAQAEGNLKSTPEQTVTVEPAAADAPPPPPSPPAPAPGQSPQQVVVQQAPPTVITIAPANPQVVYVPTYNPTVVYGAWPYPAYPPYAYYPPGYVAGTAIFSFAAGVAVGAALWGGCNWGRGDVDINVNRYNNFTKNVNTTNVANRRTEIQANRQNWQHNPEHRKGAQYRDPATQQKFNRAGNPQATQARENFRGRAEQGRQDIARGGADPGRLGGGAGRQPAAGGGGGQRPGGEGGGVQRPATADRPGGGGAGVQRPSTAERPGAGGGGVQRPSGGAGQAARPAAGAGTGGGSAFQGMGQGQAAQNYSNRGQSSRQSMGASASAHARPAAGAGGGRAGGGRGGRR